MPAKDTSTSPHFGPEIPPDADIKTLKAALRQLAQQWHPDHSPEETARFKDLSLAYSRLINGSSENFRHSNQEELDEMREFMSMFMSVISDVHQHSVSTGVSISASSSPVSRPIDEKLKELASHATGNPKLPLPSIKSNSTSQMLFANRFSERLSQQWLSGDEDDESSDDNDTAHAPEVTDKTEKKRTVYQFTAGRPAKTSPPINQSNVCSNRFCQHNLNHSHSHATTTRDDTMGYQFSEKEMKAMQQNSFRNYEAETQAAKEAVAEVSRDEAVALEALRRAQAAKRRADKAQRRQQNSKVAAARALAEEEERLKKQQQEKIELEDIAKRRREDLLRRRDMAEAVRKELFSSCRMGNLEEVQRLLCSGSKGAMVNERELEFGKSGPSLLHACVTTPEMREAEDSRDNGHERKNCHGRLAIARYILNWESSNEAVDVECVDEKGLTVLHRAADSCDVPLFKVLLEYRDITGPAITPQILISARCLNQGWTPLHYAASKGCLDGCRVLIKRGASISKHAVPPHSPGDKGDTPLELVRRLIKKSSGNQRVNLVQVENLLKSALLEVEKIREERDKKQRIAREALEAQENRRIRERENLERDLLAKKQRQLREREQKEALMEAEANAIKENKNNTGDLLGASKRKKRGKGKKSDNTEILESSEQKSAKPECAKKNLPPPKEADSAYSFSRDDLYAQLMSMGFDESRIDTAVTHAGRDLNTVLSWLVEHPSGANDSNELSEATLANIEKEKSARRMREEQRRINRQWNVTSQRRLEEEKLLRTKKELQEIEEKEKQRLRRSSEADIVSVPFIPPSVDSTPTSSQSMKTIPPILSTTQLLLPTTLPLSNKLPSPIPTPKSPPIPSMLNLLETTQIVSDSADNWENLIKSLSQAPVINPQTQPKLDLFSELSSSQKYTTQHLLYNPRGPLTRPLVAPYPTTRDMHMSFPKGIQAGPVFSCKNSPPPGFSKQHYNPRHPRAVIGGCDPYNWQSMQDYQTNSIELSQPKQVIADMKGPARESLNGELSADAREFVPYAHPNRGSTSMVQQSGSTPLQGLFGERTAMGSYPYKATVGTHRQASDTPRSSSILDMWSTPSLSNLGSDQMGPWGSSHSSGSVSEKPSPLSGLDLTSLSNASAVRSRTDGGFNLVSKPSNPNGVDLSWAGLGGQRGGWNVRNSTSTDLKDLGLANLSLGSPFSGSGTEDQPPYHTSSNNF